MNHMSLYTLWFASAVLYASSAAAQGTSDSAVAVSALTAASAPTAGTTDTSAGASVGVIAASRPFSFGVLGGASFHIHLNNGLGTGWHAGAFATADPGWPISFRLEGVYTQFNYRIQHALADSLTLGGKATYTYSTLDGVWHFPMHGNIRPYLIAGIGIYQLGYDPKCSATPGASCSGYSSSSQSANYFGVNGGAGITVHLSGFSTFVEARWHSISTSAGSSPAGILPISVGIKF
jgi:hypothetical protein